MRTLSLTAAMLAFVALPILMSGCKPTDTTKKADKHDDHGEHEEHGPHGGELMAAGDEEFHAEFLIDEKTNKVTVHLLDSKAKESDDAKSMQVTFNIKVGGEGKQFESELASSEVSEFSITDAALVAALDEKNHENVKLRAEIGGKQYTFSIEKHDHGHAHKKGDDDDHEKHDDHDDEDHDHKDEAK